MDNYYVYAYIRLDNNTYFYIGKGYKRRAYELNISRSEHFKNVINKIDVCLEILYDNLSEEEAYELERDTIEDLVFNEGYSIEIKGIKRNEHSHLVNKSWGGDGNLGFSQPESAKEKLRKIHTGKKLSYETKEKLRKCNLGKNHPNFGKKLSYETRKKISESNKKRPPRGEDWIEKLRISHMGKISPKRKRVRCIELEMEFESIQKAVEYMKDNYGFSKLKISEVCNGKRNYAGSLNDGTKLHWEYIIENDTPATTEYENTLKSEATV